MSQRGILHDKDNNKFILPLDQGEAYIDYQEKEGAMHLVYSHVPESQRGQGVGKELVEKTFAHIEENEEKAVAVCSYIKAVAERSERWSKVIG